MSTIKITYTDQDAVEVKKAFDVLMVWYKNDKAAVLSAMNQNPIAVSNAATWHNELNTNVVPIIDWALNAIMERGKQCRYLGIVYNIIQTHTVTNPTFTPPTVASLYRPAPVTLSGNIYPTWNSIGVMDSTNNWKAKDRVFWNAGNWESVIDNNIYEPGGTGIGQNIWKTI